MMDDLRINRPSEPKEREDQWEPNPKEVLDTIQLGKFFGLNLSFEQARAMVIAEKKRYSKER